MDGGSATREPHAAQASSLTNALDNITRRTLHHRVAQNHPKRSQILTHISIPRNAFLQVRNPPIVSCLPHTSVQLQCAQAIDHVANTHLILVSSKRSSSTKSPSNSRTKSRSAAHSRASISTSTSSWIMRRRWMR